SIRQIPGFGNVVNIVNKLANEGLVIIEDSGHKSMPHYHVTEKGYNFVKSENK
ncbi:MarR family transcriptional regulator, partial [Shigella sonnei]